MPLTVKKNLSGRFDQLKMWQLQHVHGGGQHPLTSHSGDRAQNLWPFHRVHAYDAFSLHPRLNDPRHFDVAHHQRPDRLLPSPTSLLHRHRDVRDENPAVSNASPTAGRVDLRNEPDIITISDSDASPADAGVHWDFGTSSSARRIQFTVILRVLKRKMEPRRWQLGSPLVMMQSSQPWPDIMPRSQNWRIHATV